MSPKYARIFKKVVIGAAVVWGLAFATDLLVPSLSCYVNPTMFRGHGGGGIMLASPICIAAVVVTLIVCLIKSKQEKKN